MNAGLQDNSKHAEFLTKLNKLDFGPLTHKLMHPEDRPGLSFEQSLDAVKKYKGFLFLCHANPGKTLSPSRYVDHVWHSHMADSELYMVQTSMLFGHFLHHFPYFGKRGESDRTDLFAAAEFTRQQAEYHFGWNLAGWCGNEPQFRPRPGHSDPTDLLSVLLPTGTDFSEMSGNPDKVTIQAGNFRHTIQHLSFDPASIFSSRWTEIERILKHSWGTACMPAELNQLNEIYALRSAERLEEIAGSLAALRPIPQGYTNALVDLQASAPAQRVSQ